MEVKQKIFIFDFDGTLTTKDTLLAFIRFVCGDAAFVWGFLRYVPLLVLMKLRLYPNWKAKEKVFTYFFRGWKTMDFNQRCQEFAAQHQHLLRPKIVETLQQAQQESARVFIVSASIENWVQPFFPQVEVLGTQIEETDGLLTGRFLTPNCYGPEKVRRVTDIIGDRTPYYICAYGDSRGDRELLQWADKGILVKS